MRCRASIGCPPMAHRVHGEAGQAELAPHPVLKGWYLCHDRPDGAPDNQ
jgi:hypothetical protein